MAKPKSKLAYLSYDQIQPRIESGELDQYDLVYEKNQKILYMIDKDMNIVPISSRLISYESEQEATTDLNNRSDTYSGQIVNVLNDDKYIPYVVNKDNNDEYYITSLNDYNKLSNIPIQNIVADAQDNLILSELTDGYYNVLGTFKISPYDETTHIVTSNVLFVVRHKDGNTYVRCLDSVEDNIFIVDGSGNIEEKTIPTTDDVLDIIDNYIIENVASQQDINDLFNE